MLPRNAVPPKPYMSSAEAEAWLGLPPSPHGRRFRDMVDRYERVTGKKVTLRFSKKKRKYTVARLERHFPHFFEAKVDRTAREIREAISRIKEEIRAELIGR